MAKKTIAIIGATGNMGSAMAKSLAKAYRLLLFAHNKEKAEALLSDIKTKNINAEVECAKCSKDASWEADIIIPAVPYAAEKKLAEEIKPYATQKIVISISNPPNETFDGLVTDTTTSAAEELQKALPDSKVVKAFNTTSAANFNQPIIDNKRVDAFVAGDDNEAVEAVSEIVRTSGFNPIVAGKLSVSRTLEQMQLLLIQPSLKNNYSR